jgi:hypothetical protein
MNSSTSLSASSQIRLLALQQRTPRFWTAEERRLAFSLLKVELQRAEEQG